LPVELCPALYEIRAKVREDQRGWKREETVLERYAKICEEMHMPCDLYEVNFERQNGQLNLSFRKNHYRIGRHIEKFGKNILITNRSDWNTDEIVRAALDRNVVEQAFRQTKDDDLVSISPLRHWTDPTIRCHFLSCIIALSYLRLLELTLSEAGLPMTAQRCMGVMRTLHSCLCWAEKTRKPQRYLETPTLEQAGILHAFGVQIVKGVLQKI